MSVMSEMRVVYGYAQDKPISRWVSELPENGASRGDIYYFAGDDGFVWMHDEKSEMDGDALYGRCLVENVAYYDVTHFGGDVPNWAKADGKSVADYLSGAPWMSEMPELPVEARNA